MASVIKPAQGKRGPGKTTVEVKAMILAALEGAGGIDYLVQRAKDPRTASAFLTLVGKVLPLQVTGADGGAIIQHRTVTFVGVDAKPDAK